MKNEYERMVQGLRDARVARETDVVLANPGMNLVLFHLCGGSGAVCCLWKISVGHTHFKATHFIPGECRITYVHNHIYYQEEGTCFAHIKT